jgi:hypothetical protein
MRRFAVALGFLALSLASLPALAQDIPDGWVLEEDAASTTYYLVHYDAANKDVDIGITCNPGYKDVVFAFYSHLTGKPEQAKLDLVLSHEGTTLPIDATGNTLDDHFVVEGIVAFEEPLNALLRDRFTVSVDGEELGHFTAKSGPEVIDKAIQACREP